MLEETHIGIGHSEVHSPMTIDEPQITSVIQPPISSEILSSTCPTSLVSSLTSRAEDRLNLSDVDLPFHTMEDPPSSGPQEPIAQTVMDTTPLNTEFNQGRINSENETATTLVTLPSATFPTKVAVTASIAVNDSASTTALLLSTPYLLSALHLLSQALLLSKIILLSSHRLTLLYPHGLLSLKCSILQQYLLRMILMMTISSSHLLSKVNLNLPLLCISVLFVLMHLG